MYDDLYSLVARNPEAHQFFASLPGEIREAVSWQAQSLHSFESLRACAGELLSEYD